MQLLPISKRLRLSELFNLCFAVTIGISVFFSTAGYASSYKVGLVTLSLGESSITRINGKRVKAKTGASVYPGDTLTTSSSGHLHLKFIDNALLSMRPDSRLSVEVYNYNPDTPKSNAIRLNLQEGLARSVSGGAAKKNNHKFRLNTPIAAIGVRGTDFTVLADKNKTRTFVSEGAIVVSPFSDDCLSLSLGPCSKGGVELKGSSYQLIELSARSLQPQLLQLALETPPTSAVLFDDSLLAKSQTTAPVTGQETARAAASTLPEKAPSATSPPEENATPIHPEVAENTSTNDSVSSEQSLPHAPGSPQGSQVVIATPTPDNTGPIQPPVYAESDTADALTPSEPTENALAQNDETVPPMPDPLYPPTSLPDEIDNQFDDRQDISSDILIPQELPTQTLDAPEGIIWSYAPRSRFSAPDFIYEQAAVDATLAAEALGKHEALSAEQFTLYRPDELFSHVNPNIGKVDYNLVQGAAFSSMNGRQLDLAIDSSMLQIDFLTGKFSTALQLSHPETGAIDFSASGDVSTEGLFSSTEHNHLLSGAASLDAREAGYYFQQEAPKLENPIDGITVWDTDQR